MVVLERETKLVICHTIFHDALRSDMFGEGPVMEGMKKKLRAQFITDVIIELGSETPEGDYPACATGRAFNELKNKLEEEGRAAGTFRYVELLKSVILPVTDERIMSLSSKEGTICVADTLYNRGNYNPILITDMKEGAITEAKKFYSEGLEVEDPDIPFIILNPSEAIAFLHGEFKDACNQVLKRDSIYKAIW